MIVIKASLSSDQALILVFLFFAMVKIVWLFGVPYAMTYEYLKHGKTHGWSIMPLFEVPPLLLAIVIAYKTNQTGWLSPGNIALWGFGLSLLAHLHLLFIWPVIGIVCIKILKITPPPDDEDEDQEGGTQDNHES